MKTEKRNEKLLKIKHEINSRLLDLDFYKKKELVLWMTKDPDYQRLKDCDNQLDAMEFWKNVWLREIQSPDDFEMQGDAFARVDSLEAAENKYLALKFAVWRIEEAFPQEYCIDALSLLEDNKYSAYAWFCVIMKDTKAKKIVLIELVNFFIDRNDLIKAIGLLQLGLKQEPGDEELLLVLVDVWLSVKQWEKAYNYLLQIPKPTTEIQKLMQELESVIKNETM